MKCHAGPRREVPGALRRQIQDLEESTAQNVYCVFRGTGKAGHGKWLVGMMLVGSKLQPWSLIVWYLTLGDLQQEKYGLGV